MTPDEAALALQWVSSEYMLRWMALLPEVTITAFGEARAVRCPSAGEVDFLNTVHRLRPSDSEHVPAIADHYRAAGVRPWLELMPACEFERLADALAAAGGRHFSFLTVHQMDLPGPASWPAPPDITVEEVGPEHQDFVHVLPKGHGVTDAQLADAMRRTRAASRIEGARRYLATVDGEPAAAAVLFVTGDSAYLASASTLETMRRRGCQTALVQRRLVDAVAAGCRQVGTITTWGSQSHANMARAGMRSTYTVARWRLD